MVLIILRSCTRSPTWLTAVGEEKGGGWIILTSHNTKTGKISRTLSTEYIPYYLSLFYYFPRYFFQVKYFFRSFLLLEDGDTRLEKQSLLSSLSLFIPTSLCESIYISVMYILHLQILLPSTRNFPWLDPCFHIQDCRCKRLIRTERGSRRVRYNKKRKNSTALRTTRSNSYFTRLSACSRSTGI